MNWDDQKMNQLCKVCGEPAAGYHFGAFTCEGCKSFFGRTYNNLTALGDCKNNGQCVINKKNRTSCKSCRLKKCLMVGMSKSGSRYGRRSNWFKIHCLIQDQAEMTSKLSEHTQNAGLLSGLHSEMSMNGVGGNGLVHHPHHNMHYYDGKDSSSSAASPTGSASSPSDIGAPTLVGPTGKPYSLFDAPKHGSLPGSNGSNGSPYESSASPPYDRKDTIVFHPLPLSPVSPLHHSKFLFHPSSNGHHQNSLLTKGLTGMGRLYSHHHHHHNHQGSSPIFPHHPYSHHLSQAYSQRYLSAVNPLIKPIVRGLPEAPPIAMTVEPCYAEVPEQDIPMDLTIGKLSKTNGSDRGRGNSFMDTDDEDYDDISHVKGRRYRRGHRDGEEGDDEDDSEGPIEGATPVETPLDLTNTRITRED